MRAVGQWLNNQLTVIFKLPYANTASILMLSVKFTFETKKLGVKAGLCLAAQIVCHPSQHNDEFVSGIYGLADKSCVVRCFA
ncbi:hypothetical protein D3C77_707740 [compost metagenome]